jgi:hypothetical protein
VSDATYAEGAWVMNGPLWLDPINNTDFVRDALHNFDITKKQDTEHPDWYALKHLKITKYDEIRGVLGGAFSGI